MQYGDRELRELWPQLQRRIPSFFAGLEIEPALLHGDLWSGNAAENEEGPGESNFHELRTYTVRCKLSAFAHNKGTNFSFDYKFNLTKLKNNFFFSPFQLSLIQPLFMATMNLTWPLLGCLVDSQANSMMPIINSYQRLQDLPLDTNSMCCFTISITGR